MPDKHQYEIEPGSKPSRRLEIDSSVKDVLVANKLDGGIPMKNQTAFIKCWSRSVLLGYIENSLAFEHSLNLAKQDEDYGILVNDVK
jgi:hypothetical protein